MLRKLFSTKEPDRPKLPPLDERCYNCQGTAVKHGRPCDVCMGDGYQLTGAGVELMNFLVRHRKSLLQRLGQPTI